MSRPGLLSIFTAFFKIGMFTIGGGYAMLPLIHREVVHRKGWMDDETFVDGLSASQACPGPIAVNLSVYAGYHIGGWKGTAVAILGTILPSFIIILLVALTFRNWSQLPLVQKAFNGLRPAVTALIAVPVIQLTKKSKTPWHGFWLPVLAVILIVQYHISPVYLIVFAILLSWAKYLRRAIREQKENA